MVNENDGTEDWYEVMKMEEIGGGIGKVRGIMRRIIGSIGGIWVLVGGMGVMNMMVV
ncbi:hypothetical protein [Bacillus subtilis]|uniref:hypothetical protein n=1 Tax=Bacillus subtilis TaxID=1423 RepID=UPI0016425C91|nr:hypothetical protein [Bacillus subtilis]